MRTSSRRSWRPWRRASRWARSAPTSGGSSGRTSRPPVDPARRDPSRRGGCAAHRRGPSVLSRHAWPRGGTRPRASGPARPCGLPGRRRPAGRAHRAGRRQLWRGEVRRGARPADAASRLLSRRRSRRVAPRAGRRWRRAHRSRAASRRRGLGRVPAPSRDRRRARRAARPRQPERADTMKAVDRAPRIVLTVGAAPTDRLKRSRSFYVEALQNAGADVLIVEPGEDAPAEFDGLCLSGGGDVAPARYGESDPDELCHDVDVARDRTEFDALRAALDRDVPVLGICRGFQVLNVARGGSLVLDLEGHRPGDPDGVVAHEVTAAAGSLLADACGTEPVI